MTDATNGVLRGLTLFFGGDVPGAQMELERVKAGVPEEACDFLFGCVAGLLSQLAHGLEVEPLSLVGHMGLNAAMLDAGLEEL